MVQDFLSYDHFFFFFHFIYISMSSVKNQNYKNENSLLKTLGTIG